MLGMLFALCVPLMTTTAAVSVGCDITGTRGDDRLAGTAGTDVICGLGGNDELIGRGGADTLMAGSRLVGLRLATDQQPPRCEDQPDRPGQARYGHRTDTDEHHSGMQDDQRADETEPHR